MNLPIVIGATVGALVLVGYFLKRRHQNRGSEKPLTSLVFLMSKPCPLTEPRVRAAIEKVWDVSLGAEMREDGDWLVESGKLSPKLARPDGVSFFVRANDRMFLIISASKPYDPNAAKNTEECIDLRLRRVIGEHRAWNSVDHFGDPPSEEEKPVIYALLGKLLAEFANEDCLAIFCPETGRCNEFAPSVVQVLKSDDPMSLFEEPTFEPVMGMGNDDPRMAAAIEEARRRWPEFAAAFQTNPDPERFGVKAIFRDEEIEEYMWFAPHKIEGDKIIGELGNAPVELKNVRKGDIVTVSLADVLDWAYAKDGEVEGLFTQKVLEEEAESKSK